MAPTTPKPGETASPPYPNDSLRWVAAEVRYPPLEELANAMPTAFRDHIRTEFPIPEIQNQLSVSVGPAGPSAQEVVQHRFIRRDRLMSVTVGRDALILEATEYEGWSNFRRLFVETLAALQDVQRPDGISRVALRYIDEVRLPDSPQTLNGWGTWIDERLVSPFDLHAPEELSNGTVVLQYGESPGYATIFRAAPFAAGRTVQQEGALRMPFETSDGPYFLLDTDASWVDPERQVPEFSTDRIAEILDELHGTCKALFESAITDQLRESILSQPREEVWSNAADSQESDSAA